MDNIIILVITFILLLIIGILAYFIYDYITYKDKVDTSVKTTTDFVNKSYLNNNSNIYAQTYLLENKFNNVNKNIITNVTTNTINSSITSNMLLNFSSNLYDYFEFDNNNSPINNKLFNYNITKINPNLNLLNQVNVLGGMSINSIKNNGLHICDNNSIIGSNCINLKVNNGMFSITPDDNNLNGLIIGSNITGSKVNTFAKFDYKGNNIYLGGDETNSPLYLNNNNVYVKNLKVITSPTGSDAPTNWNDIIKNQNTISNDFNNSYINTLNNSMNTIVCYYTIYDKTTTSPPINTNRTLEIQFINYIPLTAGYIINIIIPEIATIGSGLTFAYDPVDKFSLPPTPPTDKFSFVINTGKSLDINSRVKITIYGSSITGIAPTNGIVSASIIKPSS